MFKASAKKQNFTEGPLFFKILLFALPLMLTAVLQTLYGMADGVIVGRFSGDNLALAAIGSTSSLTVLIINLLINGSSGTGVVMAQAFGAKDTDLMSRVAHTSVAFAGISGTIFMIIGIIVSRPALIAMSTQAELLERSVLYVRIICLGIPAIALYNFCAAMLRSVGDSRTPLIILSASGLANVLLNTVFVLLFKMTIDGVALATIISQYMSAAWVLYILVSRKNEHYAIKLKDVRIHKETLLKILRYGVPSALQGAMFSFANVLVTSATNVFTSIEMSAKTIVSNIDGIIYSSLNSYMHTAMTVSAQNYGAGEPRRIRRAVLYCLIQVSVIGILLGGTITLLSNPIISLFINPTDPNKAIILEYSTKLLTLLATTYVLCGIQETFSGSLRGLGYSFSTMIISIIVICGGRALWISAFYNTPALQTLNGLYAVYPVTWITISLVFGIFTAIILSKISKKLTKQKTDKTQKTEANV